MGVQEVNTKKSETPRWKKPNFFGTQVLLLPKRIKNCDVGSTYSLFRLAKPKPK